MKYTGTIQTKLLYAVRLFAAKTDIREYLKHVRIEVREDQILAIATDGNAMAMCPVASPINRPLGPVSFAFNLPAEIVDSLYKQGKDTFPELTIEGGAEAVKATFRVPGHTWVHEFNPTEEQYFPDTTRILVWQGSGVVAQFDPKYVALAAKAADIIGSKRNPQRAHILHNGTIPARITFDECPDFYAMVAPLRENQTPSLQPTAASYFKGA